MNQMHQSASIDSPLSIEQSQSIDGVDKRRWLAQFKGTFLRTNERTIMGPTSHFGPLRVQRPFYPEGNDLLHVYVLHPPGGLVGGDLLNIELNAKPDSHVLMTTPSAGKLYRNETDLSQGQETRINVAHGASVEYLPQENIVFNGANGDLSTHINIEGDGQFLGWEITTLGRQHGDEPFEQGMLNQSIKIYRDGRPIFLDRMHIHHDDNTLHSLNTLASKTVFGTFVIATQKALDLEDWQHNCNQISTNYTLAVTQKPGIIIARALGIHTEAVKKALEGIWHSLRPMILERPACVPRIWLT